MQLGIIEILKGFDDSSCYSSSCHHASSILVSVLENGSVFKDGDIAPTFSLVADDLCSFHFLLAACDFATRDYGSFKKYAESKVPKSEVDYGWILTAAASKATISSEDFIISVTSLGTRMIKYRAIILALTIKDRPAEVHQILGSGLRRKFC